MTNTKLNMSVGSGQIDETVAKTLLYHNTRRRIEQLIGREQEIEYKIELLELRLKENKILIAYYEGEKSKQEESFKADQKKYDNSIVERYNNLSKSPAQTPKQVKK